MYSFPNWFFFTYICTLPVAVSWYKVKRPSVFLLLFTFSATVGLAGGGGAFFDESAFAAWLEVGGLFCEKPQRPTNMAPASKSSDFLACIILLLIFVERKVNLWKDSQKNKLINGLS